MPQPDPVAALWIARLTLTGFRNYQSLDLRTEPSSVVLIGDNGAGKTNLLEALSFLSPGRGLRRAAYLDVATTGGAGDWAVATIVNDPDGACRIGTGLQRNGAELDRTRRIRIDGVAAKRAEDLLDRVRILWLTPAMDGLFTGPAGDRRRFLDRFVLAIDRDHAGRVSAYEKAMRGRNRLLDEGGGNDDWLTAVERQMAELAVAIAAARRELVDCLNDLIGDRDGSNAFPKAELALQGVLEAEVGNAPAVDLEDGHMARLRDGRGADRTAGRTLAGPHRSDLLVRHGPKHMEASLCSTGEQKALLIGLVLAQADLVGRLTGRAPIILLDEVAAHLDRHRRAGLFAELDRLGCQAWMTGTEWAPFADLKDRAQVFQVADGTVAPVDPD